MKTKLVFVAALVRTLAAGILLAAPMAYCAQAVPAETFSATTEFFENEGESLSANSQDSGPYLDGTRAINEGRWSDAVAIFTKIVSAQGGHADGALYWKAYAENKQGQSSLALSTCLELRRDHPKSRWIEECGALEIEILDKSGQPIQPQTEQNDDLKLLALNSLMKQDELRALPEIQQILNGDLPEKFKELALFILAQGESRQAQKLLEQIAQGHSNTALQAKAAEMIANRRNKRAGSPDVAPGNANGVITLDVVVTDKSGQPVAGLQAQDFRLLDNEELRDIFSVYAADEVSAKGDAPVEAILVVDRVNSSFKSIADTRVELVKYLRQNGGHLALPTSFIFLSDTGTEIQNEPTRDGNALIAELDQHSTSLRLPRGTQLFKTAGGWRHLSLIALDRITAAVGKRPGRKLLIWISPGWPAFSGQSYFWLKKDQQPLFDYIAGVSTALREARITIYSIDPEGVGHGQFYYLNFVKGVDSAKKVNFGDLLLQVLAKQTGGLVFSGNNDIASLIDRCVADANADYVLSFNPPPGSHSNEYHSIEIRIHKPELRARTRTGYYAQP
jgi:VWFA-related protein